jgi:hypothetical protein
MKEFKQTNTTNPPTGDEHDSQGVLCPSCVLVWMVMWKCYVAYDLDKN